jgi:hypothetical protein
MSIYHCIPVADLDRYAAMLGQPDRLRAADGRWRVPVLLETVRCIERESRAAVRTWRLGPQSLQPGAILDLWMKLSEAVAGTAGARRAIAEPSAPRPLVLVVSGDPASLLGVSLAGFAGRDLEVIAAESLAEPSGWIPDRRFTLVISAHLLTFDFLGRLCAAAAGEPGRRRSIAFSLMTAPSLAALSRLVAQVQTQRT